MKINPICSERRCKCLGSVWHISGAHLGHKLYNGRCFGGSPSAAYFFCKLCRNQCRSPWQCRLETAFTSVVSSIYYDLFASLLPVRHASLKILAASSWHYHADLREPWEMLKQQTLLTYGHDFNSAQACQISVFS